MDRFPETRPFGSAERGAAQTLPVEVTKTIRASPAKVLRAWGDPELVKQWWGPDTFGCSFAEVDFAVGGTYRFAMRSPDGKDLWSAGTIQELDPARRLVLAEEAGMTPGIITVEVSSVDGEETELRLRHDGLPAHMHDDCVDAWSSSLRKLRNVVETQ